MITASDVTPKRIEREARIRLASRIAADVTIDLGDEPSFAFTAWGARPTTWRAGRWKPDSRQVIAESPIVGQSIVLAPGTHLAWLQIWHDGEKHVIPVGKVRIV